MYTYTFNLINKSKWFIFIKRVTDRMAFEFEIGRKSMFIKTKSLSKQFSVFFFSSFSNQSRLLMDGEYWPMMLVVMTLKLLPCELMVAIRHTPTHIDTASARATDWFDRLR